MEYIQGNIFDNSSILNINDIQQALKFIKLINLKKEVCPFLVSQDASDSYSSLLGHIENINERLNLFDVNHLPSDKIKNSQIILNLLKIKWQILLSGALNYISNNKSIVSIEKSYYILSPSDFGFHNAIVNKRSIFFIDFEFSGWDDPGKLYCDFILQPKIHIPKKFHLVIKNSLLSTEYIKIYDARLHWLYELLKFKWIIIQLSFLNKNKYLESNYYKLKIDEKNWIELIRKI